MRGPEHTRPQIAGACRDYGESTVSASSKRTTEFAQPRLSRSQKKGVFRGEFLQICSPLLAVVLWVPHVLLVPISLSPWARHWTLQKPPLLKPPFLGNQVPEFEQGQTVVVVASDGVQIWVCLFLYGRSWGSRGNDRPFRNKHTQICTPPPPFDPTQTGLRKFGCGFGARWPAWEFSSYTSNS